MVSAVWGAVAHRFNRIRLRTAIRPSREPAWRSFCNISIATEASEGLKRISWDRTLGRNLPRTMNMTDPSAIVQQINLAISRLPSAALPLAITFRPGKAP
jgi:hypothetical protein